MSGGVVSGVVVVMSFPEPEYPEYPDPEYPEYPDPSRFSISLIGISILGDAVVSNPISTSQMWHVVAQYLTAFAYDGLEASQPP